MARAVWCDYYWSPPSFLASAGMTASPASSRRRSMHRINQKATQDNSVPACAYECHDEQMQDPFEESFDADGIPLYTSVPDDEQKCEANTDPEASEDEADEVTMLSSPKGPSKSRSRSKAKAKTSSQGVGRVKSGNSETSWSTASSAASSASLTSRRSTKRRMRSRESSDETHSSSASLASSRYSRSRGAQMLRHLAHNRNNLLKDHMQLLEDEHNTTLSQLQYLSQPSSSSSVSAQGYERRSSTRISMSRNRSLPENPDSSPSRVPHRDSLKRKYSASTARPVRLDSKRVSLRGLTKEEGHLTRDEAMNLLSEFPCKEAKHYQKKSACGSTLRDLIRCARNGDTKGLVAILDDKKANVDIDGKSSSGKTALITAAEHGHVGTVIALFGRGANLEVTDPQGNTALMRAAAKAHHEAFLMLLSAGARDDVRNSQNKSIVVIAATKLGDSKRHSFKQRLHILRTTFERATPNLQTKRIPQYQDVDQYFLENKQTRDLLEGWSKALTRKKDLHIPSYSEFHKCDLNEFFETKHARWEMHVWCKVLILLCFVVFDNYFEHFDLTSYRTYIVYGLLYIGAYSI